MLRIEPPCVVAIAPPSGPVGPASPARRSSTSEAVELCPVALGPKSAAARRGATKSSDPTSHSFAEAASLADQPLKLYVKLPAQ